MKDYYVAYTDASCIECNRCTEFCDIVFNPDDGCKINVEYCTLENKQNVIKAAQNCPLKRILIIDEE